MSLTREDPKEKPALAKVAAVAWGEPPYPKKKAVLPGGRTAFAKVHLLPSTLRMKKKEKVGEANVSSHGFTIMGGGWTVKSGANHTVLDNTPDCPESESER